MPRTSKLSAGQRPMFDAFEMARLAPEPVPDLAGNWIYDPTQLVFSTPQPERGEPCPGTE